MHVSMRACKACMWPASQWPVVHLCVRSRIDLAIGHVFRFRSIYQFIDLSSNLMDSKPMYLVKI